MGHEKRAGATALNRREFIWGALALTRAGASPSGRNGADAGFRFTDATSAAGIHFQHNSGAFGDKYLPETLGPGCAFLDYDNDGWQDILLINGMDWPGHAKQPRHHAPLSQQP